MADSTLVAMTRCGMALLLTLGAGASAASQSPAQAQAPAVKTDSIDVGWPRQYTSGGTTFTVYQPQLDQWEGDKLASHAAAGAVGKG